MGLKRCLFGCLLALASVGTAAAMGVSSQDPGSPHATIDSGSQNGGGTSDDASDASRDCLPAGTASGSSDDGHGGGGSAVTPHPRAAHRSSLSWQSLLPGSIQ